MKYHIEKNSVQETLVIPLYGRKLCTERFPNLFRDNKAVELIYAKIFGKRGLMKLGSMCCHADIINYGSLPYTDFIRTRTLCQGGDICDFRFVRHETDAGDGWKRSESI